jgi:hypothetical protein
VKQLLHVADLNSFYCFLKYSESPFVLFHPYCSTSFFYATLLLLRTQNCVREADVATAQNTHENTIFGEGSGGGGGCV